MIEVRIIEDAQYYKWPLFTRFYIYLDVNLNTGHYKITLLEVLEIQPSKHRSKLMHLDQFVGVMVGRLRKIS